MLLGTSLPSPLPEAAVPVLEQNPAFHKAASTWFVWYLQVAQLPTYPSSVTYHKFSSPHTLWRMRATIFSLNHSISHTRIIRAGLVSALMAATSTRLLLPGQSSCSSSIPPGIAGNRVSIYPVRKGAAEDLTMFFTWKWKKVYSEQFPLCVTGIFLVMEDTCKKEVFTYLVQNFNSCGKGKSSEESFSLLLLHLHFISKLKTVHLLPPCL